MAVIHITDELLQEQPLLLEVMRKHYTTFRELQPRTVGARTFEVQLPGLPVGDVTVTPKITTADGKIVFIHEQ